MVNNRFLQYLTELMDNIDCCHKKYLYDGVLCSKLS